MMPRSMASSGGDREFNLLGQWAAGSGQSNCRRFAITIHDSPVVLSLESFLEYWPSVRNRTRRLIPLIPPDKLEWVPVANRWSLGDQIRHLAGIERWMYGETLHGRPTRYPGHTRDL